MNEVATVTGANSGIGAAAALELGRRGMRVVLAARRVDKLEAHVQTVKAAGGEALTIPTDLTDPKRVTRLVERTMATFGRVDVLVNNAGANWLRPLATSSPDEVIHVLDVNLLGAMLDGVWNGT